MSTDALNALLCSRIEHADELFNHSEEFKGEVDEFEQLILSIEEIMSNSDMRRQFLRFETLLQSIFTGKVRYGYVTGYQDAKNQHLESSYIENMLQQQPIKPYIY